MKALKEKYNSSDLQLIQDENNSHKYYIMLEGYIIGVQYKTGS